MYDKIIEQLIFEPKHRYFSAGNEIQVCETKYLGVTITQRTFFPYNIFKEPIDSFIVDLQLKEDYPILNGAININYYTPDGYGLPEFLSLRNAIIFIYSYYNMFEHTKVYKNHFNLGPNEHHYCEICGRPATGGIHHIDGRGQGMDVITNLMGICAEHHHACEMSKTCNEYAKEVHNMFLKINPYKNPEVFKDTVFKVQMEKMNALYSAF